MILESWGWRQISHVSPKGGPCDEGCESNRGGGAAPAPTRCSGRVAGGEVRSWKSPCQGLKIRRKEGMGGSEAEMPQHPLSPL